MRHSIDERLRQQDGVIAAWQLRADGHSPGAIRHARASWREVHNGVYLSGHTRPTLGQRWRAGTLTTPTTVLSGASGLAFHGLLPGDGGLTTVSRPGKGRRLRIGRPAPGRFDPLIVSPSTNLALDTVQTDGIPILSAGRMVLDHVPTMRERAAARLMRDALRLEKLSPVEARMIIGRHHGRPGMPSFRALANEYIPLALHRTRSDAEALALAILQAAGVAPPLVNVRHAGEEADLSWLELRLIVELDGRGFHQFPTEDDRKQQCWERAGWTVRRLSTDDVYDRPDRLLAICPPPQLRIVPRW
jgi:hypothetical protein